MTIAILDYDAGNLTSVARAVHQLGVDAVVTKDPAVVRAAKRVIFPGVGAAASCMDGLRRYGLDAALRSVVADGRPTLAICVGMQLLFDRSEEDGGVPCLGLLPGTVERIEPGNAALKVPHMGWNAVRFAPQEPLAQGLGDDPHCYFVHSYRCVPGPAVTTIGTSDHGQPICAAVRSGQLAAVQFHPEKSGIIGLQLLRNFLAG